MEKHRGNVFCISAYAVQVNKSIVNVILRRMRVC